MLPIAAANVVRRTVLARADSASDGADMGPLLRGDEAGGEAGGMGGCKVDGTLAERGGLLQACL
ncbi:hypothetical protein GCM10009836_00790 [Pseudonocardia ailaonensis]|uniref:Uncharacterized protein n=1 Tax=Pseudonocardia ailaonensis TaxID=367279 RepID=A0ABN2MH37_9PSEU